MKFLLSTVVFLLFSNALEAQWNHRFPAVDGFNHQVYLEGFDLPIMNAGPTDPAPSPDGQRLAFAAKGWIWVMDLDSGQARRITSSGEVDSRPEWSPDGEEIVFNRDHGRRLSIVSINLESGLESTLIDVDAINLDPVFSPDGKFVYYSSARGGHFHLWRVELDSLDSEQLTAAGPTQRRLLKRRPQILTDSERILYLRKQGTSDSIEILDVQSQVSTRLIEDRITAQTGMSLSPDGKYLAYTWPFDGGHELRLMAVSAPDTSILLTQSQGMPLAPAFSHDGKWIYFSEANEDERNELKRISVNGGAVETGLVKDWRWGSETGILVINSRIDGQPAAVRISAVDDSGHPLIPRSGAVRSEAQNDRIFFYSTGEISLEAPSGNVSVTMVQGFETPASTRQFRIQPGETTRVTMALDRIWDASEHGWFAGDNHFHLNYGGNYRLVPEDILPDLKAEGVDVAFPLLANLHNRFLQQDLWGWSYEKGPIVHFGQEVRSHFLGHVQQIGTDELFWPWVWGPGYQLYEKDDRPNAELLRHARNQGGLGGYVHPVAETDPFTDDTFSSIPVGFIADAVLGEVDLIELGCLWTDETGTGALWHSVLNLGIPLAASAGSDVMNDYYRTMAIGATRVYVKPDGALNTESYLTALKEGHSFVSTGPLLEFEVEGQGPGQIVDGDKAAVNWVANVHSALPYDRLQIFVNGTVVQSFEGQSQAGSKTYRGVIDAPSGGWVTARVTGQQVQWPAMNSILFAESSPVWFGSVGSTNPDDARRSARELLLALDVAEASLNESYGDSPIPRLRSHFSEARKRLEALAE